MKLFHTFIILLIYSCFSYGEDEYPKIMKAIFGNFDIEKVEYEYAYKGSSEWIPFQTCKKETLISTHGIERGNYYYKWLDRPDLPDKKYATLKGVINYTAENHQYTLAVTQTAFGYCNACPPIIGISLLKNEDSAYSAIESEPCLAFIGANGFLLGENKTQPYFTNLPEFIKVNNHEYGVLINRLYNNDKTGYFFKRVDGKFKLVYTDYVSKANYMASPPKNKEPYRFISSFSFVEGKNPDHWDMIITTSGTNKVNGQIIPWNTETRYVFNDGIYKKP